MPKYAIVKNGELENVKEIEDISTISTTKFDSDGGLIIRPFIEDDRPTAIEPIEMAIDKFIVTPENVTREWRIIRIPLEQQKEAVKLECRRRILDAFPEWKQMNMTARGVELMKLQMTRNLTVEEQEEMSQLEAAWEWVKLMRTKSGEIEAMDPIPANFMIDDYWS